MWCVLPFFLFSSVNSLSVCFASMYFMCTHIVCRAQYNNKEEAKKNNNQLYRINLCAAGRQCTQITHTCTRYTTIHTLQTFLSEFTIFKFIASLFAIFVSFLYQSLTLTLTASEHCEPIVNAPVQLASFIAALIRSLLSAHVPIMWGFEREKYFDCENETHTSSSFSPFLCRYTPVWQMHVYVERVFSLFSNTDEPLFVFNSGNTLRAHAHIRMWFALLAVVTKIHFPRTSHFEVNT